MRAKVSKDVVSMGNESLTLSAIGVLKQLHMNGVTHIVSLPDTESNFLHSRVNSDPNLSLISVAREGECVPIAAGLWIGGQIPIVMIQNTGLLESGDSVRGLALDVDFPLVIFVGYRGWTRNGEIKDSAAILTEPTLNAWGLPYYLIESDLDVSKITEAFKKADMEHRPIVLLIGAEYTS